MLQHAVYTLPNYKHGYCTDDNARALILMMLLEELEEGFPERTRLTSIYAAFLQNAFDAERRPLPQLHDLSPGVGREIGSEESHGRALWALGTCVGRSRREELRSWAAELFEKALPAVQSFTSPRAWAFAIIGLHEYLRTLGGDLRANQIRAELAQRLSSLYEKNAGEDWMWFEQSVTYENARLPQALIMTGRWANLPDSSRDRSPESALACGTPNRSGGAFPPDWFQRLLEARRAACIVRPAARRGPCDDLRLC